MTTLLDPPTRGLVHLGLLHDDLEDAVERCLPEVRATLEQGGAACVFMERRGVRAMRDALGPDAERVAFPVPIDAVAGGAQHYLRELRRQVPLDRRTLIVGQYAREHPPQWDPRFAEDAVNLVLGDLPLTVLCVCDRGHDEHTALAAHAHEHLVDAPGTRVPNPDWAAPASSSPAPMGQWGAPVATLTFDGPQALSAVRRRITEIAERAGLGREGARAAVLAGHEAVLLAGGADLDATVLTEGCPEVRVRASGATVVTEALAARPGRSVGTTDVPRWRADHLPRFCDRMALHEDATGRLVRVLNS